MLDDKTKTDDKDDSKKSDSRTYTKSLFETMSSGSKETLKDAADVGETIKTIGLTVQSMNAQIGGSANLTATFGKNFVDAGAQIQRVSENVGSLELGMAKARDIQVSLMEQTGRVFAATGKELAGIATATEATGVASDKLVKNFKEQGFALEKIPQTMEKVINKSREMGVNAGAVAEGVVVNLGKLNTFNFSNGVEGLTKMAIQATMFGIDMSKIFQTAEKLFNPEAAIDMAANLQRLGVATGDLIDPLKLMDLGQNNPQELQNQIVEMSKRFTYFNEQNQKFEILPGAKREMREIAQAVGMSAEELAKLALGSSELGKKMSEIRFPQLETGPLSEEQQTMIANLSEMRDGKYQIQIEQTKVDEETGERYKTGVVETKAISELTSEDLKSLELQQKESSKSLEEVARESMSYEKRTMHAVESGLSAAKGSLATSRIANKGTELLNQKISQLGDIFKEVKTEEGREVVNKGFELLRGFGQEMQKAYNDGKIDDNEKKILMEKGKEIDSEISKVSSKATNIAAEIAKMALNLGPDIVKTLDQATSELEQNYEKSNGETQVKSMESALNNPNKTLDQSILDVTNQPTQSQQPAESTNVSNSNVTNNNTTNNKTTNNDLSQTYNQSQHSYNTQNTNTTTQGVFNIDFNPLTAIQSEQLKIDNQSFAELKTLNENSQKNNQTLIDHLSKLQQPVAATNQRTFTPIVTNSFASTQTPRLQTPFNLSFNPSNQIPNITNISNYNTPSLQNMPSMASTASSMINYSGELNIKVDVTAPPGTDITMINEAVNKAINKKEVQDGIVKNAMNGKIGEYNSTAKI